MDDASLKSRPLGVLRCMAGRRVAGLVPAVWVFWTSGCQQKAPSAIMIHNRGLGPMTIAVGPALNFSGAADFDPAAVADLMASELSYLQGVRVIPVSRVLAAMLRQGRSQIESPEHALEVAAQVGADAILVFAVTEYDPYRPPVVGIAAQLYAVRRDPGVGGVDSISVRPEGRPFAVSHADPASLPTAQTQRVFDASHDAVVEEVKRFASKREAEEGPWGWNRHLVSQRHYLRFCCYATLEGLISDHELTTVGSLSLR